MYDRHHNSIGCRLQRSCPRVHLRLQLLTTRDFNVERLTIVSNVLSSVKQPNPGEKVLVGEELKDQ
ncbi:hypothetical protein XM38_005490 [Halomicronema hongdechloris C2206]|uniref:Uncharacterized protein n=1 Tax=Halomicronema hongdechloris C2206 TaxID=1641165 RepID=A0A1Z3HH50_9CYAN|nr:hypothetical protein XM38_005490 [Halomicronema hongdechloris C2206]